jgi:hypothetical protein
MILILSFMVYLQSSRFESGPLRDLHYLLSMGDQTAMAVEAALL